MPEKQPWNLWSLGATSKRAGPKSTPEGLDAQNDALEPLEPRNDVLEPPGNSKWNLGAFGKLKWSSGAPWMLEITFETLEWNPRAPLRPEMEPEAGNEALYALDV